MEDEVGWIIALAVFAFLALTLAIPALIIAVNNGKEDTTIITNDRIALFPVADTLAGPTTVALVDDVPHWVPMHDALKYEAVDVRDLTSSSLVALHGGSVIVATGHAGAAGFFLRAWQVDRFGKESKVVEHKYSDLITDTKGTGVYTSCCASSDGTKLILTEFLDNVAPASAQLRVNEIPISAALVVTAITGTGNESAQFGIVGNPSQNVTVTKSSTADLYCCAWRDGATQEVSYISAYLDAGVMKVSAALTVPNATPATIKISMSAFNSHDIVSTFPQTGATPILSLRLAAAPAAPTLVGAVTSMTLPYSTSTVEAANVSNMNHDGLFCVAVTRGSGTPVPYVGLYRVPTTASPIQELKFAFFPDAKANSGNNSVLNLNMGNNRVVVGFGESGTFYQVTSSGSGVQTTPVVHELLAPVQYPRFTRDFAFTKTEAKQDNDHRLWLMSNQYESPGLLATELIDFSMAKELVTTVVGPVHHTENYVGIPFLRPIRHIKSQGAFTQQPLAMKTFEMVGRSVYSATGDLMEFHL